MSIEFVYSYGPYYFDARTFDMLEHFVCKMEEKGLKFETIGDIIFYMGHLALTHICIKDLKNEYSELEEELNQNSMINKISKK